MLKRTSGFFGIFLIFLGIMMMIPTAVALMYGEYTCVRAFLYGIFTAIIPGILILIIRNRNAISEERLKLRYSYFVVSMAWLTASAISAIPFYVQGAIPNYVNAFFEMCSGFSTTGSTIIQNVEVIPKSLMFWRAQTQWLGGMGIIVFVMAFLPSFGINAQNIASAETPGPISTKITARFTDTAKKLYLLYIFFTVLLTVLLMFGHLNLFDAITHSFTTMATGGFGNYGNSIAHFNSYYVYWVLTIFMLIAGTNFNLFFMIKPQGLINTIKDDEFSFYIKWVGVATALITMGLMVKGGYHSFWKAFTDSAFQVSTIISTTGFATADFDLWPAFCKIIIILLMFTGACSSSTAGGIKIVRVLTVFRMIKRDVKSRIHGKIFNDVRLNGHKLEAKDLQLMLTFTCFFIVMVFGVAAIISIDGFDPMTNFTASLTCMSNVGPGLAGVGPVRNFYNYSDFSTLVLSLTMIAGRLELYTFMILFSRHFWNPDMA